MANFTVSSAVDSMMQSSDNAGILQSIGSTNYPYTTDFQAGVEQTRNLTSILNSDGYYGDGNLSSVYVGSNVTSIGSQAFMYSGLAEITISDGVTSIGPNAMRSCPLTSITIPNNVTSIGESVFYGCTSMTSATIGNGVETLSSYAFDYCTSLASVILGNSVTNIGSNAFYYNISLPSINIPNSVTSIGSYAFYNCQSLATVNCLATTAPSIGGYAFGLIPATEIHVPVGSTGYGATYGGLTVVADL